MAKWGPAWTNGTAEMRRLHSNINRQQAALHIWTGDTIQCKTLMSQKHGQITKYLPSFLKHLILCCKDQFELANRKPPTFEPDAPLHIWTAVVFLISLSNFSGDQLINCNQLVFVNFCPIVCCGRFYRNFSLCLFCFLFVIISLAVPWLIPPLVCFQTGVWWSDPSLSLITFRGERMIVFGNTLPFVFVRTSPLLFVYSNTRMCNYADEFSFTNIWKLEVLRLDVVLGAFGLQALLKTINLYLETLYL